MLTFTYLLALHISSYLLVSGCGRSRSCPPRDNTAPVVTCPTDRHVIADPIQINTKVWWDEEKEVSAYDNRDGKVSYWRVGLPPGLLFSEGTTTVRYHAKDNSGNHGSCSFRITVQVLRCPWWGEVKDGWKICHLGHDMRLGGVCRFGCYGGHELVGASRTECLETEQWDTSTQPYCQKLQCSKLTPASDQYGKVDIQCTDGRYYRSKCTYHCADGYGILPGHSGVKVCTEHGNWLGDTPVCVDTSPPVFQTCPYAKVGYAERSKTTGRVWWDEPLATDNSGTVTTVQTSGPRSGTDLPVGEYTVTYMASDSVNNTAVCQFKVIVKQIRCHTIYPLPYTSVVCPAGRIFGSSCEFMCDNGTSINGPARAECDKTGNPVPYGSWTFGNHQPYCEMVNTCPELTAPDNGALACDTWLSGRFCQMLCQEGYVVMDDKDTLIDEVNIQKTLLVCGDSGSWHITDDLPNCQKVDDRLWTILKITLDYLYYSGECNTSREDIKLKFLQAFNNTVIKSCQAPACSVSNVKIICGNRTKRSISNRTLSFEVDISLSSDLDPVDIVQTRSAIKSGIREAQSNGDLDLDIDGVTLEASVVDVSHPEVTCEAGAAYDRKSLQCVACNAGFYHDTLNNVCSPCSRGTYQDIARQTACKTCDTGKTTEKKGAVSESQCIDACPVGYYSSTGTPPCSACDLGSYSDATGSTHCTECSGEQITLMPGAASTDLCQEFDVTFTELNDTGAVDPAKLAINETFPSQFTITLWLKCSKCDNILRVEADDIEIVSLRGGNSSLLVGILGKTYEILEDVAESRRWHRFTLSYSTSGLLCYLGDTVILQEASTTWDVPSTSGFNITLGGSGFVGLLSQLQIWSHSSVYTPARETTCFSDARGDLVYWQQFSELDGSFIMTKSTCDAVDNCESSPCQNGGICTDAAENFTCECVAGFTGNSCEIDIDDCSGHACDNGATCIDDIDGYKCACTKGFTGDLCETKVVDGGWTEWEVSGQCSVTCGTGVLQRSRVCENPLPINGGKPCDGDSMEYVVCETNRTCVNECENDLPPIENGELNCNWTDNETRVCQPTCNDGYDFDSETYLSQSGVVCGPETGYTWNHNNTNNPYGQLPSCTEKVKAKENKLNYTAEYPSLSTLTTDLETSIKTKVNDRVAATGCIGTGRCAVIDITVYTGEADDERRRRSTTSVVFTIQLTCDVRTDMNECYNLLSDIVASLENFINQLAFTVQYDGGYHDVGINSTSLAGTAVCDPGYVPVWQYCVSCGKGMYDVGGYCDMCPLGYYQDNEGMTSCKACPDGWTTEGLMTRDSKYCNVQKPIEDVQSWILLGVAVGAGVAVLIIGAVVTVIICKKMNSAKKTVDPGFHMNQNYRVNAKPRFNKHCVAEKPFSKYKDGPDIFQLTHVRTAESLEGAYPDLRDDDYSPVYLPRYSSITPPPRSDTPCSISDIQT